MNNCDIFICTHKDFEPYVNNNTYKILTTVLDGAEKYSLKTYYCDNVNLPLDNKFYSELWHYKYVYDNIKLNDYVGFCHYRRYFDFGDDIPNFDDVFKKVDIILPKKLSFGNNTIKEQYALCHNIKDLNICREIIYSDFNDYIGIFDKVMELKEFMPCNMFIMKKENFYSYCDFIFGVLDKYIDFIGTDIREYINEHIDDYCTNRTYPSNEVDYQYRIGGYLAERLTNVFIVKHFSNARYYNMVVTENKYGQNNIMNITK